MDRLRKQRSGALNKQITIIREIDDVSASGAVTKQWGEVAVVRAEVVKSSIGENDQAFGEELSGPVTFRIRYRDDVLTSDRIVFDQGEYDIQSMELLGRRHTLEIKGSMIKRETNLMIGDLPIIEEKYDPADALYMLPPKW